LAFEFWTIWLFFFEGMSSPFEGEIFFFSFPHFQEKDDPGEMRKEEGRERGVTIS
jgi:hypothetical protein